MKASAVTLLLLALAACTRPIVDAVYLPGADQDRCAAATYVDKRQFEWLMAGDRSHWLQPWRSYQDTVPASKLRDAVGTYFPDEKPDAASVGRLAAAGFRTMFRGFSWNEMDFDDPTRFSAGSDKELRADLQAMKGGGVRPLIQIESFTGVPCPARSFDVQVMARAAKGSRQIRIDTASAGRVVIGRTGFDSLTESRAIEVIFTDVATQSGGALVTLSRPLPVDIEAGTRRATELRFAPFRRPRTPADVDDATFLETLNGWLAFVDAATTLATSIFGANGFDLEVSNGLGTRSYFLDINSFYNPPFDTRPGDLRAEVVAAILRATLDRVRARVGTSVAVVNGYTSNDYAQSGATVPAGVTGYSRRLNPHHYGWRAPDDNGRSVDAEGRPNGTPADAGEWQEAFTPSYQLFFPEAHLTAVGPQEFVLPDLSPLLSTRGGVVHGRTAAPTAASRAPDVWITAISLNPGLAKENRAYFNTADVVHWKAKALLRTLSAYVGTGAARIYMYAPGTDEGGLALMNWSDPEGGPIMQALQRYTNAFSGPADSGLVRPLSVTTVRSCEGGRDFAGDGTTAHPDLRHRDVLAAFPFQVTPTHHVISTYVMTRDMSVVHQGAAPNSEVTRIDLPAVPFTLTIAGIDGRSATIDALDPITGAAVPTTITSRSDTGLAVTVALTDAPRLLSIRTP